MVADLGGLLSWSRFGRLVRQLPRESALARAMAGEAFKWHTGDYILADLFDAQMMRWWAEDAGRAKAAKKAAPQKPKPRPRPGEAERRRLRLEHQQQEMERLRAKRAKREAELAAMPEEVTDGD